MIYDDGSLAVMLFKNPIKKFFSKMNTITFSEELKGLGVHEAYHVLQYRYVYEHGGSKAIKKLLEDVRKVNYEDNILEEVHTFAIFWYQTGF